MDDVTADMLTDQLDEAEGQEAILKVLVAAAKAQIRCQHSLGCRLHSMDNRLSTFDRALDKRIDERNDQTVNKTCKDLADMMRSCPARNDHSSFGRGFSKVLRGASFKDLIILILVAVVATMAGVDISKFIGG